MQATKKQDTKEVKVKFQYYLRLPNSQYWDVESNDYTDFISKEEYNDWKSELPHWNNMVSATNHLLGERDKYPKQFPDYDNAIIRCYSLDLYKETTNG